MVLTRVLLLVATAVTALNFEQLAPKDAFLDKSAASFVRDYSLKLRFYFANVSESRVIAAEVAHHTVADPKDANATIDAATYRVNMLMNIHFNSPKFSGHEFVTVASADYTCINRTDGAEACEAQSFLQNERRAESLEDVPDYIRPAIDEATSNQYKDEEPVWTAYETQVLSTTSNGHMDYVQFVLDGEPMPCQAAFYYDGTKSHMVDLDWSCYSATYVQSKMERTIRNGYIRLIATGVAILMMAMSFAFVVQRRCLAGTNLYHTLSFTPPVQESPVVTDTSKSYSSMRV
ncbi:hypothetical protein THRCLA_06707 [Thraustotheca clavata]|uniref:Secreted protein n=1 Tax=Thraustotheca clavata TaxID=74557 RepID=A0A1V9ZKK8_9STRA|nr:hypothetical protein THRCLA_06707 [Thraustotheca clavata]